MATKFQYDASWAENPALVTITLILCTVIPSHPMPSYLWKLTLPCLAHAPKSLSWVIYCLLLSPLRGYPGPLLARISPLWVVMQCRRGQRSQAVSDLHQRYGDFVRISPNHISIADAKAVQQIYGHKTGFLKGPFYEDMLPRLYIEYMAPKLTFDLLYPFTRSSLFYSTLGTLKSTNGKRRLSARRFQPGACRTSSPT
jgi:hypothetical protein